MASEFEELPNVDWVVDAAANPSVLAGVAGKSSSRQVVEHNLAGTINILEYCRRYSAGLILVRTSRVYSIEAFQGSPCDAAKRGLNLLKATTQRVSSQGISECFSTRGPVSLYGATKLSSEILALGIPPISIIGFGRRCVSSASRVP